MTGLSSGRSLFGSPGGGGGGARRGAGALTSTVRSETGATESLRQITELQSQLDRLRNQVKAVTNEKDTLAAELAEAER